MAEFTTILERLELPVRLGIHAHEEAPQRVRVDVRLTADYPAPLAGDEIEHVVDYDFVRTGIHALAAERRFALQETLCEAIAVLCLADRRIVAVTVRTTKLDVYPDARVGCEISRRGSPR